MSLPVVCCLSCALVCALGTVECWGGRQGGCGPELCVRRLRVCGSQLAVCLVSLFVSVCRSCVSSSSVQRPPIPRWCPVRAWLFFTFLPTYLLLYCSTCATTWKSGERRPPKKKAWSREILEFYNKAPRFLAIPNNSNTHTSFGAWSPVHARARRADRVAR